MAFCVQITIKGVTNGRVCYDRATAENLFSNPLLAGVITLYRINEEGGYEVLRTRKGKGACALCEVSQ